MTSISPKSYLSPALLLSTSPTFTVLTFLRSWNVSTNLENVFKLGDELSADNASASGQLVGEVGRLCQGEGLAHRALQRSTQDGSHQVKIYQYRLTIFLS